MELEKQRSTQIDITFNELQSLNCEDIASRVPKETALTICQLSLEDCSAKIVEVLSIWLRKLLRAYLSEAECCLDAFKSLYGWFILLKDAVSSENKEACSDFITLLDDALSFVEWGKAKLLESGERVVHTVAFFLLGIVYSCLQYSNENNVDALKKHEPEAIALHMTVLYLLREISQASRKVHARITPLLRQLIQIADFLNDNLTHQHAFVKTSKTMTNICTHYITSSQDEFKTMPDWLQDTVLHLCDTVLDHIETIYKKETLSVPVDKLEEYLEVTQAYLIMLHKLLSCSVMHIDKAVLDTIIALLNGGESKPSHDLGENIPRLLSKYVRPLVMQIYELIYQVQHFQKHLIGCLTRPSEVNEDYYDLCMDFLTVSIVDTTEISQHTCQTILNIFDYLFKDPGNFTNALRYARIIEIFGTLLQLVNSTALFNTFISGIFQEDIIKSQVCADVLMLYFRLEHNHQRWSNSELTQATNYWNKCNNLYALHSQSSSQWHVQRMLRFFSNLCDNQAPLFNINNYRYLYCVSNKTEQQKRLWQLRIQRILKEPISDTEQYYEMLALMELLSGHTLWLPQVLSKFNELISGENCRLFVSLYFTLALQSDRATQVRILQGPMPAKHIANSCWQMQKFLHTCKASRDAQLKFWAEQHTICADMLSILDVMLTAPINKQTENKACCNYNNLQYRRTQSHQCNIVSLKRKRSADEHKENLRQLELLSQRFLECLPELDANDVQQLKSIIENLNRMLSH